MQLFRYETAPLNTWQSAKLRKSPRLVAEYNFWSYLWSCVSTNRRSSSPNNPRRDCWSFSSPRGPCWHMSCHCSLYPPTYHFPSIGRGFLCSVRKCPPAGWLKHIHVGKLIYHHRSWMWSGTLLEWLHIPINSNKHISGFCWIDLCVLIYLPVFRRWLPRNLANSCNCPSHLGHPWWHQTS